MTATGRETVSAPPAGRAPRAGQGAGEDGFGRVSLLLHGLVGMGVLGLLAFGFWLRTVPGGADKTALVQAHKSFGLIVLAAALARVAWRMREGFPAPASPHRPWERRAAVLLHVFLLAATLLMPLSGILRSVSYARPVSVFGLPLIPRLFAEKHETLYAVASTLHDGLALALTAALVLHVAAALKHHLIDRDATLTRMTGLSRRRQR